MAANRFGSPIPIGSGSSHDFKTVFGGDKRNCGRNAMSYRIMIRVSILFYENLWWKNDLREVVATQLVCGVIKFLDLVENRHLHAAHSSHAWSRHSIDDYLMVRCRHSMRFQSNEACNKNMFIWCICLDFGIHTSIRWTIDPVHWFVLSNYLTIVAISGHHLWMENKYLILTHGWSKVCFLVMEAIFYIKIRLFFY